MRDSFDPREPGLSAAQAAPASTPRPAPDDTANDLARFRQFAVWITAAVFTFGVLEIAAGFVFAQPWIGIAGGLSLAYGLVLIGAGAHLRGGGRVGRAAL